MQKQNRTDRILILAALAILLIATGLFYFDGWMWGSRGNRGERIGILSKKAGDVRMKFEGELKWQKAAPGQDLIYNDSIYAGAASEAQLQLGQSEMQVTENTLVVLRREDNVNFMNLSYGSLFGNLAKNEKVIIDTGDGKPIELTPSTNTRIVLKKVGDHSELSVTSGSADLTINGKKTKVEKDFKVVVDGKSQPKVTEKTSLQLIKPLHDQVFYSENPSSLDFQWKYNTGRKPAATEDFTVEFATNPTFNKIHAKREVKGQLNATLNAAESLSLFYRVRGPNGEISPTEKVNFVRLNKPLIVKPVARSQFLVPAERSARVEIEFRRPQDATVWYQIANDQAFQSIVALESTKELTAVRDFAPGQYFMRAKSDFGEGHETAWTDPVPFTVDHKIEKLDLIKAPLQSKVYIPNVNYPETLYKSEPAAVKEYLAKRGLLKDFFPFPRESYDQINLKYDTNAKVVTQSEPAWPKEKLRPGRYQYRYQTMKKDFQPSPWSEDKKLEITMEPPRPVGDVVYGPTAPNGVSEAQWKFTPILFAGSYDVEVSNDPGMRNAREVRVTESMVKTGLTGDNYWRARARDPQGRIISEFSPTYKMKSGVPTYLAREPREPQRKPAAVPAERTATHIDQKHEEPFEKNGWWAWLGMGENYVDYRQSNNGRGSLSDFHTKGPSKYLETGFIGQNSWGGVFSYKSTPGTFNPTLPDGVTLDRTAYTWNTISGEGVLRKTSPFSLFGTPITYGMRVGIQQHDIPFVFLDSDGNLQMKNNKMTTASAGLLAEWTRRRVTYYWLMRYQYPLTSQADGSSQYSISPVFAFDGSVGASYNFTRQLKAGLFWYGQWHQFGFTYADGAVTNQGFQSLFYSNVDLRLGWDF
ncbi:MAG: hypothetical protein ACXVA9_00830 [Bdellovibrionales bacterium]